MRLRNRIVKASFWTDGDLLRWPRAKRMTYQGLWAMAEDSGCLENDPFSWRVMLWPSPMDSDITEEVLAGWRDEMFQGRKLVPYSTDGKEYIYVARFHRHERPRNPQAPNIPLPPWVKWEQNPKDIRKGSYKVDKDIFSAHCKCCTRVVQRSPMGEDEGTLNCLQIAGLDNTDAVQDLYNDSTGLVQASPPGPARPCPARPCPVYNDVVYSKLLQGDIASNATNGEEEKPKPKTTKRGSNHPHSLKTIRNRGPRTDGERAFLYWAEAMGKQSDVLYDGARKAKCDTRLKNDSTLEDITAAVDGCLVSPHHMGDNDTGQRYDDLSLICRDRTKVEWFREKAPEFAPDNENAQRMKYLREMLEQQGPEATKAMCTDEEWDELNG